MTSDVLDYTHESKSGFIIVLDELGHVNIRVANTGQGVCGHNLEYEEVKRLTDQLNAWLKENRPPKKHIWNRRVNE